MSALQTIDSLQFARSAAQISGDLRAEDAPRTGDMMARDYVAAQYQTAKYELCGGMEAGRPVLRLQVRAAVVLTCQRCLEQYVETLEIERTIPVARNESELALWERDDPLLDALVADAKMNVLDLVEDEILLSLPSVPRHPEGECGEVGKLVGNNG